MTATATLFLGTPALPFIRPAPLIGNCWRSSVIIPASSLQLSSPFDPLIPPTFQRWLRSAIDYLTTASGAFKTITHLSNSYTMKSIVSILACAALSSLVAAGNGEFSVSVSLVGRTTIQFDVGCTCDADCNGRYSYEAVCQKNICVKKDAVPASTKCTTSTTPSSVIVAPTSRTTQQQNVGCTCDADCKGRYPYDTVCSNNICVKKDAQPTSSPITKTTTVSMPCSTSSKVEPESHITAPSSPASSMIVAPTSRTTQQQNVGCTCDADCKGRYSYEAVCLHNICVKKDAESTTMSTPTSTPVSTIVQPTSRTTQDHHAGCTCDEDCGEGSYCDNGMCKKKATVQPSKPASTPCTTTPTASPSVTIAPTSRTTQDHHAGCTCDEDCGDGYYCDKGTCKKKATVEPTSPTTSPCTTTSPSVTIQPTSRTTQDHHVGCTCDEDCGAGYYCDKGTCKKKATVEPTQPMTSPCTTTPSGTVQPTSRTTQDHHAGGCTCDEDCGAGYYCDNGTCKKKATVEPTSQTTSPCTTTPTTSPSVTILPTSRTTQDHHVGCTCDDDCGDGYYCDNGTCKHKATVNPTQRTTPCTKCSPSVTVLPTNRTTQDHHAECTCDEDCGDDYSCDNGTCKHKATVLPTQRDTTSCTTTPSVTLLPTQRTTMTTVVTPTTSVPVTTLPVFESSGWKNGVSWTVGIVGALVVLLA